MTAHVKRVKWIWGHYLAIAIFDKLITEFVLCRVENDVKLLRNRVRMLQMEHEKAQRKIKETAKKTEELISLRKRNDDKFVKVGASVTSDEHTISLILIFSAVTDARHLLLFF